MTWSSTNGVVKAVEKEVLPIKKPEDSNKEDPGFQFLLDRRGFNEVGRGTLEILKWWAFSYWCKEFTSIVGAANAWCGITQAAAEHAAGREYPKVCEGASDWIGTGVRHNWKQLGIPKNAIVVIRHRVGKGYHVTRSFRDHGIFEKYFEGLGGNQNNELNVKKFYHIDEEVVWVGIVEKSK